MVYQVFMEVILSIDDRRIRVPRFMISKLTIASPAEFISNFDPIQFFRESLAWCRTEIDLPEEVYPHILMLKEDEPFTCFYPFSCLSQIITRCALLQSHQQTLDACIIRIFPVSIQVKNLRIQQLKQIIPVRLSGLMTFREEAMMHLTNEMKYRNWCVIDLPKGWKQFPKLIKNMYAAIRMITSVSDNLEPWVDLFDRGRFVGFRPHPSRPFLQTRLPRSGVCDDQFRAYMEKIASFFPDQDSKELIMSVPEMSLKLCTVFESIGTLCHSILFRRLNVPVIAGDCRHSYRASVLRTFEYSEVNAVCGLHADLGLLTISPKASSCGLKVLDPILNDWISIDESIRDNQLVLFAGELMGELSEGAIRPCLHAAFSPESRISMPFFYRLEPDTKPFTGNQRTYEEYVHRVLYDKRHWRLPTFQSPNPDF